MKMHGSSAFHEVIPAFVLNGAILSLKVASLIRCVPFELENGKGKKLSLRKLTSPWKLRAWYFVSAINIAYTTFQCISFSVNVAAKGFNTDTAIQTILLMRSMLAVLFFINNPFHADGIVWEVNQFCLLLERNGK